MRSQPLRTATNIFVQSDPGLSSHIVMRSWAFAVFSDQDRSATVPYAHCTRSMGGWPPNRIGRTALYRGTAFEEHVGSGGVARHAIPSKNLASGIDRLLQ